MAEKSYFWGGTSVGDAALAAPDGAPYTDDKFSDVFNALLNFDRSNTGVIFSMDSRYSGMFAISPTGSGVTVQPGAAMVDGKLYVMDNAQTFSMPSNGTYQVVLRKDFNAQTVRMVFRAGSTVTQVDGTIWEIELYRIQFVFGLNGYTEWNDKRHFLGLNVKTLIGVWEIGSNPMNGHDDPTIQPIFSNLNPGWPFRKLRLEWDGCQYDDPNVQLKRGTISLVFNGDRFTVGNYRNINQIWYADIVGGTPLWQNYASATASAGGCGANGIYGMGWCEIAHWNQAMNKLIMGYGFSPGDQTTGPGGPGWIEAFSVWNNTGNINTIEVYPGNGTWGSGKFSLFGMMA